jgi:arylsulfatase A-like enzyme
VVVAGPVENVDIVPTLLALLGLPAADDLDGRSLLPAVSAAASGQPPPPPRPVFSNSSQYTAVRAPDGRKAILPWDPAGPRPPLQFDLATDPHERSPRPADDPAFAPLRQALSDYRRRALKALRGETVIDAETRGHMAELGYLEDGPDDH